MTASLPACDRTDRRTVPVSTYMMVGAGSPCAKIVVPCGCSVRCVWTPLHVIGGVSAGGGVRMDLLIDFATKSTSEGPCGPRPVPCWLAAAGEYHARPIMA